MPTEVLTVYGISISGNCQKVRTVCNRLAIPYRWMRPVSSRRKTQTPAFQRLNPAGQVPVIVLPDGRVLAQSNAIIRYLADGSDLIPDDRFERAQMDQWLFWEQYSHETAIAVRRFHLTFLKTPEDKIDPALLGKGKRALGVMDVHLEFPALFRRRAPDARRYRPGRLYAHGGGRRLRPGRLAGGAGLGAAGRGGSRAARLRRLAKADRSVYPGRSISAIAGASTGISDAVEVSTF